MRKLIQLSVGIMAGTGGVKCPDLVITYKIDGIMHFQITYLCYLRKLHKLLIFALDNIIDTAKNHINFTIYHTGKMNFMREIAHRYLP